MNTVKTPIFFSLYAILSVSTKLNFMRLRQSMLQAVALIQNWVRFLSPLLVLLLFAMFLASCNKWTRIPPSQVEPNLKDVVTAIQHQYTEALKELKKEGIDNIEITEAAVSLKVTKSIAGSGEIKVLIFKPSRKRTLTSSSAITYTLSKAEDKKGGALPKLADQDLKGMIVNAATQFSGLDRPIGDLVADNFEIDITFGIENSGSAGLSFEILGLSIDAGPEYSRSAEHELKLTFKKKPAKA